MQLSGKIAVVTGVSKGIGESIVTHLLNEGCTVYGLGRNSYPHSSENFHFIPTNVRNNNEIVSAFEQIFKNTNQKIDVLINNAGLGYFGNVEDLPLEHWTEMIETNINAVFYCTRLSIPAMKKMGGGHVINIASTAGLEGMPMVSGYCATKWAVKGFSESLWREVREDKIKVTCIYPGSVKTDFFNNSPNIKPHDYMLKADDIASTIIHALKSPDNCHHINIEIRPLQPKGPKNA